MKKAHNLFFEEEYWKAIVEKANSENISVSGYIQKHIHLLDFDHKLRGNLLDNRYVEALKSLFSDFIIKDPLIVTKHRLAKGELNLPKPTFMFSFPKSSNLYRCYSPLQFIKINSFCPDSTCKYLNYLNRTPFYNTSSVMLLDFFFQKKGIQKINYTVASSLEIKENPTNSSIKKSKLGQMITAIYKTSHGYPLPQGLNGECKKIEPIPKTQRIYRIENLITHIEILGIVKYLLFDKGRVQIDTILKTANKWRTIAPSIEPSHRWWKTGKHIGKIHRANVAKILKYLKKEEILVKEGQGYILS